MSDTLHSYKGIAPTYGRILIEKVEKAKETQSKEGLWLPGPQHGENNLHEGVVRAVGPGNRGEDGERVEMDVMFGDRVLLNPYQGQSFKIDGKTFLLVQEGEVLAVVKTKKGK